MINFIVTRDNFKEIEQIKKLPKHIQKEIEIVGYVFPFKTNMFVINELIDWDNYKKSPFFLLHFPQKEMISNRDYCLLEEVLKTNDTCKINKVIKDIRSNSSPNFSRISNSSKCDNNHHSSGIQHRYKETVLFFPDEGQDCFAYCLFCFRFEQFLPNYSVSLNNHKIDHLLEYLREHTEVTDILFTGGDPFTMHAKILNIYLSKILTANISHITTIRIGTKALTYWPYRFLSDDDSEELLDTLKKIVDSGLSLKIITHFNHYIELDNKIIIESIKKLQHIGALIYSQSPVLKGVNDNADVWVNMWKKQVKLGIIPYYMYVLRDCTGTKDFFKTTLDKCLVIFKDAYSRVSGIAKTVRGPVMSCEIGKIRICGTVLLENKKYFVLEFIQSAKPNSSNNIQLLDYNSELTWLDDNIIHKLYSGD